MTVEAPGRFFCPCCQRKFKFVDQLAGKSVYCHCGAKIRCADDPLGDATLIRAPEGQDAPEGEPASAQAEAVVDVTPPRAKRPSAPVDDLPAAKASTRSARSAAADASNKPPPVPAEASTTNSDLDELSALAAAAGDDEDQAEESLDALQLHDDSRDGTGAPTSATGEYNQPDVDSQPDEPIAEEEDELTLSLGDDEDEDADDGLSLAGDEPEAPPARASAPTAAAGGVAAAATAASSDQDDDGGFDLATEDPEPEADDGYGLDTGGEEDSSGSNAFDLALDDATKDRAAAEPATGPNICPNCQEQRSPGSVLCLKCGFNSETGGVVNTQVRSDGEVEEEHDESFKEHLMMNLYVPLGMAVFGILLILFNSFVVPNDFVIIADQMAEEEAAYAAAWEEEQTSPDEAAAEAKNRAEEDEFLAAQGIEELDVDTARAIVEAQGDINGDGQTDDVEYRIWTRSYDVVEEADYGSSDYGTTGGGGGLGGNSLADMFDVGARVLYFIRTWLYIGFSIPCIFLGMIVISSMFGNSFGAIIPAAIKLVAIIIVTQAVYDFCTSILLWMTEGINLMGYIGFSISMAVFWPLCTVFFDLDWMEVFILYLLTFFAPYIVIGCLCMGMMAA